MGALRRSVGLIDSKGCSKLFPVSQSPPPSLPMSQPNGPFSSLVICVTGLSKEARTQVKEATVRLGGEYSPHLHLQCTHLLIAFYLGCLTISYSSCGRKFEHTLKHGARNGLFVVTLGWFVDSVKRNLRMSESLYKVKQLGQNSEELTCVFDLEPVCRPLSSSGTESEDMTLSHHSIFVDSDISDELRLKVLKVAGDQGAKVIDSWFIGCNASLVVCEGGASVQKYLGHINTIVSPLWVLKTVERHRQRLVHMSPDLARQLGLMLENLEDGGAEKEALNITEEGNSQDVVSKIRSKSKQVRKETVNLAKTGVRRRRARHMQTCQNPIRRITQNNLLENICWTISEAAATATVFTDSSCTSSSGYITEPPQSSVAEEGKDPVASFSNSTRALTESEKTEVIFKDSFLTILYPADRFSEMGPSSRTYFSDNGFTCLQILDYIHTYYQENLPENEIELAIHTDSRHADRLRTAYCNKEESDDGYMVFTRLELLGSRKSFEMLKRVNGENNSNVYELMIRA
ncbi:BnaAnng23780D [Brassica napus]|uniref:BnaAnng23780D protein n=1 Tax=Brassica napus TaxID=3708 RepID=A0A078JK61_BRANA|nr:BnaAnng23780D [Brassica napus]